MLVLPTEHIAKIAAQLKNTCENVCLIGNERHQVIVPKLTAFITDSGELYIGTYNGEEKGALFQVEHGDEEVLDAAIFMHHLLFVTISRKWFVQALFDCPCCLELKDACSLEYRACREVMVDGLDNSNYGTRSSFPSCNEAFEEETGNVIHEKSEIEEQGRALQYKKDNLIQSLSLFNEENTCAQLNQLSHISATSEHLLFYSEKEIWQVSKSQFIVCLQSCTSSSSKNWSSNISTTDIVIPINETIINEAGHVSTDPRGMLNLQISQVASYQNKSIVQLECGSNFVAAIVKPHVFINSFSSLSKNCCDSSTSVGANQSQNNSAAQGLCDPCASFIEESNLFEEDLSAFLEKFNIMEANENMDKDDLLLPKCFGTNLIRSRRILSEGKRQFSLLDFPSDEDKISNLAGSIRLKNSHLNALSHADKCGQSNKAADETQKEIGQSNNILVKELECVIDDKESMENVDTRKEPSYFESLSRGSVLSLVTSGIGDYVGHITKHLRQPSSFSLPAYPPSSCSIDADILNSVSPHLTSIGGAASTQNSESPSPESRVEQSSEPVSDVSCLSGDSSEIYNSVKELSTSVSSTISSNLYSSAEDKESLPNISGASFMESIPKQSSRDDSSSEKLIEERITIPDSENFDNDSVCKKNISISNVDHSIRNSSLSSCSIKLSPSENMFDGAKSSNRSSCKYLKNEGTASSFVESKDLIQGMRLASNQTSPMHVGINPSSQTSSNMKDGSTNPAFHKLLQCGRSLMNSEIFIWNLSSDKFSSYVAQDLSHKCTFKIACSTNIIAGLTVHGKVLLHRVSNKSCAEADADSNIRDPASASPSSTTILYRDIAGSDDDDAFFMLSQRGELHILKSETLEINSVSKQIVSPDCCSLLSAGDTLLLSEAQDLSQGIHDLLESESKFLHILLTVNRNLIKPLYEWCLHYLEKEEETKFKLVSVSLTKEKAVSRQCLLCKGQVTSVFVEESHSDSTISPNDTNGAKLKITNPIENKHIATLCSLLKTYISLIDVVSNSVFCLIECTNKEETSSCDINKSLPIVADCEELCKFYASYIDAFCDVIALGTLDLKNAELVTLVKKASFDLLSFLPDNLKPNFTKKDNKPKENLNKSKTDGLKKEKLLDRLKREGSKVEEEQEDMKEFRAILEWILRLPIDRIFAFEELLSHLVGVEAAQHKWRQLSLLEIKAENEAKKTKGFWNSWVNLPASVFSAKQRILLDSREYASVKLTAASGKLLNSLSLSSSGYVILLSDALLHCLPSSHTVYCLNHVWLSGVEDSPSSQLSLEFNLPEEKLILSFASPSDRKIWFKSTFDAIESTCSSQDVGVLKEWLTLYDSCHSSHICKAAKSERRMSSYSFTKHPIYKGANYSGEWKAGQMDGIGILSWADGFVYCGAFAKGRYHGTGTLTSGTSSGMISKDILNGATFVKGHWREGKLHGWVHIRYSSGDTYTGWVSENQCEVFGNWQSGNLPSNSLLPSAFNVEASTYTGSWKKGLKDGYGVEDNIRSGCKYMGGYRQGERHGRAVVITSNGVYYEASFIHGRPQGNALVVLEDGTVFEGEIACSKNSSLELVCNGRGCFYYQSGDRLEGSFSGILTGTSSSTPVKVSSALLFRGTQDSLLSNTGTLGMYSSDPSSKWNSLFEHYKELLQRVDHHFIPQSGQLSGDMRTFSSSYLLIIYSYLDKAFSCPIHPLSQLLTHIVAAFRASYGSNTSAPALLLPHAIQEIHFFTKQLYSIIRSLFPILPSDCNLKIEGGNDEKLVLTPSCLVHTWLLPQLYSPLSTLYLLCDGSLPQLSYPLPSSALSPHLIPSSFLVSPRDSCSSLHPLLCKGQNSSMACDKQYWQHLCAWNVLPDYKILQKLDIERRCHSPAPVDVLKLSKGELFSEAIEIFQMITTSFLPRAKLSVVQLTFRVIQKMLNTSEWCSLDALFPVFVYVVVRARVQRLGVEIRLMDDLLEEELKKGELDYMYTNLTAAYYHICDVDPPSE